VPILLGGVFTFTDGRQAIMPWNTLFLAPTGQVLPLFVDVAYDPHQHSLIRGPLQDRWLKVEEYYHQWKKVVGSNGVNLSPNGFRFSLSQYTVEAQIDLKNHSLDIDFIAPPFAGHQSSTNTHYTDHPLTGQRKGHWTSQKGVSSFMAPSAQVPTLHSWASSQTTDLDPGNLLLNTHKPSFLFLPGAVWVVRGLAFNINTIPFENIGALVSFARGTLQGSSERYVRYTGNRLDPLTIKLPPRTKRPTFWELHFAREAFSDFPADLPFEWGIKGDQEGVSIVSIPASAATKDRVLSFINSHS